MEPRTISRGIAPLVEYFECIQPAPYFSLAHLATVAESYNVRTEPRVLASRLVERGWFKPTGIRGVYEFLPASTLGVSPGLHYGPILAARELDRGFVGCAAGHSAAYLLGFADRCPSRLHVAVPHGGRVPAGLRRVARVHRYTPRLPVERLQNDSWAPVLSVESLLVSVAESPGGYDWNTPGEWLPEAACKADPERLELELDGRPNPVRVRLGYLLQNVMPEYAADLHRFVERRDWFGPRGRPVRRYSNAWQLFDTCIPWDPATLVRGEIPTYTS